MNTKEFKERILPLSERIFPLVARLLGNQFSAQDAVQEIMLKLWNKRKKLANHPNIPAFVFLTARNYCLDLLKKKNLGQKTTGIELQFLASNSDQNLLEWNELNSIIKKLLQKLPEQQREIMIMRDIDGLEFAEIAAMTQLKIEHVRVLLSRARKQIRLQLNEIYEYEKGGN